MDPRLRVVYLAAVAVAAFVVKPLWAVGAVAAVQLVLWFVVGLAPVALARQLRKLILLAGFLVLSFGFNLEDATSLREMAWSTHGALVGVKTILRIIAVVLASQVARAGDPRSIAVGLRGLGLPERAALTLDTVLALIDGSFDGKAPPV